MYLTPINKEYLIEKGNILNEMRSAGWTLRELRFFSVYLSKINPRDLSTRVVRFTLSHFERILDLKRVQKKDIKPTIDGLLSKIARVPMERNGVKQGVTAFQLFKECSVYQSDSGVWYVEIEAHDKAVPFLFNLDRYFVYQLWNALRLSSFNQIRMYEILKQYEKKGERILSLLDLRALLGIESAEYPRWERFKNKVLDVCQCALAEKTDIKYTYEPIRNGRGGKVTGVKFKIEKNDDFTDQLTLAEYINLKDEPEEIDFEEECELSFENKRLELYSEMCNDEFSEQETQVLYDLLLEILPNSSFKGTGAADFLKKMYGELNYRATKTKIPSRFNYLRGILKNKLKEKSDENN